MHALRAGWDYLGGFVQDGQKKEELPPTITIHIYGIRSPLLSIIQIAYLHLLTGGVKLYFKSNGLGYHEESVWTQLERTRLSFTNAAKGTSRESLSKLSDELKKAIRWYPPSEDFPELVELYKIYRLGLTKLSSTYKNSPFCKQCLSDLDEAMIKNDEEGIIEKRSYREITPVEPENPLSKKIKSQFSSEKIKLYNGLFQEALYAKTQGKETFKFRMEAIYYEFEGDIKQLQELIESHYKNDQNLD